MPTGKYGAAKAEHILVKLEFAAPPRRAAMIRATNSCSSLSGGEALVDGIILGSRGAMAPGTSPRECASMIEDLEWLIALLVAVEPALTAALARIRDAIR